MISYENFWKTLKNKNISQNKLIKEYDISSSVLTRMRKNEYLGLRKIEEFCQILDCGIGDIVEYIPGEEEINNK